MLFNQWGLFTKKTFPDKVSWKWCISNGNNDLIHVIYPTLWVFPTNFHDITFEEIFSVTNTITQWTTYLLILLVLRSTALYSKLSVVKRDDQCIKTTDDAEFKKKGTEENDSYHLSANPVKLVVTLIVHLVHEISEQFPKVVVVRRLEKIQPPHIPQVCGQLFCKSFHYPVNLKYKYKF